MSKKYIPKKIEDYSEEELLNLMRIKMRRKGVTYDPTPIFDELERRKALQNCKEIKQI